KHWESTGKALGGRAPVLSALLPIRSRAARPLPFSTALNSAVRSRLVGEPAIRSSINSHSLAAVTAVGSAALGTDQMIPARTPFHNAGLRRTIPNLARPRRRRSARYHGPQKSPLAP